MIWYRSRRTGYIDLSKDFKFLAIPIIIVILLAVITLFKEIGLI